MCVYADGCSNSNISCRTAVAFELCRSRHFDCNSLLLAMDYFPRVSHLEGADKHTCP